MSNRPSDDRPTAWNSRLRVGKPMARGKGPKAKPSKSAGTRPDDHGAYVTPAGRIICPLCELFDAMEPPEWLRWRKNNPAAAGVWFDLETHHVYRQRHLDKPWNRLRTCGGCHRFSHAHPVIGTAAGMLVKDAAGRLELEAAAAALRKDPVAWFLHKPLVAGEFAGCDALETAVRDLCRRHGL